MSSTTIPITASEAIDTIYKSEVGRVLDVAEAFSNALVHLKFKHVIVFPASWAVFTYIGYYYFEKGLGRYHATSSKYWSALCKAIFLFTFVVACNLLQLMVFDILDMMHPSLRNLAWTSSL